jgi:N-acetyl-anhydromuramyl-L-alanine amidase AmpD
MRESTPLSHTFVNVARIWDGKKGNSDHSRKPIDLIVIHTMEGFTDGSTAWFQNPATNASAHYGVSENGDLIQWIPETMTAFHAGNYSINQRSIGIEHEDKKLFNDPRPDALYETSARLVAELCKTYGIPMDRQHIIKHNEVPDPNHAGFKIAKSCPGSLDIDRIVQRAIEINTAPSTPQEAMQTYQMTPSVFTLIITKSTNWDDFCSSMGIDSQLAKNAGMGKQLAEQYKAKLQAQNTPVVPPNIPVYVQATPGLIPTPPSVQSAQVPNTVLADTVASIPQNNVWDKSVFTVLSELLSLFTTKGRST